MRKRKINVFNLQIAKGNEWMNEEITVGRAATDWTKNLGFSRFGVKSEDVAEEKRLRQAQITAYGAGVTLKNTDGAGARMVSIVAI